MRDRETDGYILIKEFIHSKTPNSLKIINIVFYKPMCSVSKHILRMRLAIPSSNKRLPPVCVEGGEAETQ